MHDKNCNFDADLLILGAGPAGLSAAQYGSRANLRALVVEEMAPGGQALNIDVLENYPGNVGRDGMPPKGGFEFCEDLRKQAEDFGAAFIMEGAVALVREGPDAAGAATSGAVGGTGSFAVTLSGGRILRAPVVILATGAKRRTLDIPGEKDFEGRGVSYCATCDGPFFKGKRILVVGGGDSACDEARYLSRLSDKITMVHRKSVFRAQKSLADRVLSDPNIKVRFNTRLVEIRGEGKVGSVILTGPPPGTAASGGTSGYEEPADAVFIFAGSIPKTDLVRDLASLDQSGYVVTDQSMATSVPGLYAAGDVRSSPFRQVVVAAGEGAVAAHCAAAYIDSLKGEVYH
ncbi:MAG: FAD-dependent oxidoreductase [Treponema sp.]|jgi:thioredoxin reductase (NADPH)|nr:FAD-dependent oxidoreductase [Treponema sp.]